jgi:hypothetical protein
MREKQDMILNFLQIKEWQIVALSSCHRSPSPTLTSSPTRPRTLFDIFSGSHPFVPRSAVCFASSAVQLSGRFAPSDPGTQLRPSAHAAVSDFFTRSSSLRPSAISTPSFVSPSQRFTPSHPLDMQFIACDSGATVTRPPTLYLFNQSDAASGAAAGVFAAIGVTVICAIAAILLIRAFVKRRSRLSSSYNVCTTDVTLSPSASAEGTDPVTFLNPCLRLFTDALYDTSGFDGMVHE